MNTENAGDNPVRDDDQTVGKSITEDLGSSLGSSMLRERLSNLRFLTFGER